MTKHSRAKCPICSRPVIKEFSPFCSKRCQEEDLGNWLFGHYAVPTNERVAPGNDNGDDED